MKVFAFLFVVASVSAKGSGPYLPSGWKPDGPAFYLPSEVVKPLASSNPTPDLVLDGSEASGSDSLSEYGPPPAPQNEEKPAEIPATDLAGSEGSGSHALLEYGPPALPEILNQGLPDAVTEQNFSVELNFAVPEATSEVTVDQDIVKESVEQTTTVNTELPAEEKETTESDVVGSESAEVNAEIESLGNVITEANVDSSELPEPVAQTTESIRQEVANSGFGAEPFVQNIPDVITDLENEVASQQAEVNAAVGVDQSSNQAVSGSLEQAPEGFLEYGPPGFTEYGPPKGGQVSEDNLYSLQSIESNAERRRRFSPKFRSSKKN